MGGANDASLDRLLSTIREANGLSGVSSLLGRSETADPATAALAHAFASNILDYDDTHWATAIHPAGAVASALLGWAGTAPVTGEDLLHAFMIGMEVSCRIGLAVSPGHYEHGWHITSTCGVFGAAVAVGRVMGLSPRQMTWAIGHAATQSSGLVASLGTMAKTLNIAHAARNGLVAAQYAKHGITASETALEARFGFAEVMSPKPFAASLTERLGEHWEAEHNTFKPYPCGFLLHPALDACLASPGLLSVDPSTIENVQITLHPLAQVRADRPHPKDGLEAKLSVQHAVAVALLHGNAKVRAFTDLVVNDPVVRACRSKMRVATDESLATNGARLEVRPLSGQVIVREVPHVRGEAASPMSDAALEMKFRDLVAHGAPHCDADLLLAGMRDLPHAADATELVRLTRPIC